MGELAARGPYQGHPIRKARQEWPCENYPRSSPLRHVIIAGERYVEGDVDPDYAGGFGHYRICLKCAELTEGAPR